MTTFDIPLERTKPESVHPWSKTVKDEFSNRIQGAHSSVKSVDCAKPKERVPSKNRVTFKVIGNRTTKEFIYCVHLVQGMHKYRWKVFNAPVIRGCSGVEWPSIILKELQVRYGASNNCLQSQVAVICNDKLIGGEKELKELIETKYYIHLLAINYQKEAIEQFTNFIKSTGRPCAYLHFSINKKPIGSMIFMLYADVVPQTCENFLRLCRLKRGGYSGSPVHRVVKDGWIQCGGFGLKNVDMGCENFTIPHDRRGVLAMANAGRHMDCSTQFFVLLQSKPCFKFRFVAFGQLIDGEETLKRIEEVETVYEAPTANITIYSAGVVNLDCQDIKINKGCREYIEKHIDDLNIVGEMFYEMLIENVFLEIELRKNKKLEIVNDYGEAYGEAFGEAFGETVDEHGNYLPDNIHATRRFIRKKEEMESNVDDKSQVDTQEHAYRSTMSRHSKVTNKENENEVNNDFDVESVSTNFEAEQYSYSKVTPSEIVSKPAKPYYLAMTDVPYPGEVDSIFDFRRFLQGDYCLESDLNKNLERTLPHKKWAREEKLQAISQILTDTSATLFSDSSTMSATSDELDSDEEKEIRTYIQRFGDTVSFAGKCIRNIAKQYIHFDLTEKKSLNEQYADEEIRRLRMAVQDVESRENKRVSIDVKPWETHHQIKRRQTGFIKPQNWINMVEEEEDQDMIEDTISNDSRIRIRAPETQKVNPKIRRKQTGFVDEDDLIKIKIIQAQYADESDMDIDIEPAKGESVIRKTGVRIAPTSINTEETIDMSKPRRTSTASTGKESVDKPRPSVLLRLYEDVNIDDLEKTPTLKDYKPLTEMNKKNSIFSDNEQHNPLLRRKDSVLPACSHSLDEMHINRNKNAPQLPSRTPSFEPKPYPIRPMDFARTRPSVTVSQYQRMNILAEQKRRQQLDDETLSRGIRLPGDSPVYDQMDSEQDLHFHGSHASTIMKKMDKIEKSNKRSNKKKK